MKRTGTRILLTAAAAALPALAPLPAQAPRGGASAVAVAHLTVLGAGRNGKLCVGRRNAIRAELETAGAPSPVPVRLLLVLPGGDPAGALVAEGSVAVQGGRGAFTFVNVEVPERLRGRGARLVVRAPASDPSREPAIHVDAATDWGDRCS